MGRTYGMQVLFRQGSRIPMLAVDVGEVGEDLLVALVQTASAT